MPDKLTHGNELWAEEVRTMCNAAANRRAVSPDVHLEDFIFRFVYNHPGFESRQQAVDYYFNNGALSAFKVRNLVETLAFGLTRRLQVLEFASGYGMVTRHAVKALKPHVMTSCDIHARANSFNQCTLGVETISSHDVPENFETPRKYDVIFVLSFFSHMPRQTWGRWLTALYEKLRPGGILIFTTHGKESLKFFPRAVLDQTGFWFEPSSEQKDLSEYTYGMTVTTRTFVDAEIVKLVGAEYLSYKEADWWGHQDLYIVRSPKRRSFGGRWDRFRRYFE